MNGPDADSGKWIVEVDPEIVHLVPDFLANRQRDVETILQAVERGDLETVRRVGHIMKGCGGGYGFPIITEIGKAIEEAAKCGDVVAARAQVDRLSRYLASVEVRG